MNGKSRTETMEEGVMMLETAAGEKNNTKRDEERPGLHLQCISERPCLRPYKPEYLSLTTERQTLFD